MGSYCTAQGTMPSLFSWNMMEGSIKKKRMYIYVCVCVCMNMTATVQQKLKKHCKSTILKIFKCVLVYGEE